MLPVDAGATELGAHARHARHDVSRSGMRHNGGARAPDAHPANTLSGILYLVQLQPDFLSTVENFNWAGVKIGRGSLRLRLGEDASDELPGRIGKLPVVA